MKKGKVLTFCTWTSIGSILQSYGLKKAIEQIGYNTTILLPDGSNEFFFSKVHSLKSLISRSFQILIHKKRVTAHRKRLGFIERCLDVEYYRNYEALESISAENRESFYLAGSDQIWHPDQCNKSFFLEFVRNSKKISYAASMGKTAISNEKRKIVGEYLNGFERISVREEQCRDALQSLTSNEILVHVDPTFLLEQEHWRALEQTYPIEKPYILVYMIYWDSSCRDQIKELKKRTGLPVYAVCSALSRVYADHFLFDVGIEEFLWLVDHAEFVITSSFHGAAMSAIFNKKFAAVINPALPSRVGNLMQTLHIPVVRIDELDKMDYFDYSVINENISRERNRGIQYLSEAING